VTYKRFQTHNFPGAILYQRTGTPAVIPPGWEWLDKPQPPVAGKIVIPDLARHIRHKAEPPVVEPTIKQAKSAVTTPVSEQRQIPDPVEEARELLEYGHSERARDLLLQTVEQEGEDATLCTLLGQACANLGEWDQAAYWCDQATHFDKLALEAYYTLALVKQHLGEIDKAIQTMKKVVYVDRTHVLGHFGLADLYHHSGQLRQALKALDNTHRLLGSCDAEDVLPNSGGITVERLQETVVRQQQQWQAEAQGM
jgi:tetratricopeptide (TPR) repeat protein